MLSGMKFTLDKLGPINHAELELGDLTIIAGKNNTGKTYTATVLYGIFQKHRRLRRTICFIRLL